ncbi:MAG: acyltransferase family protein [Candidatus Cryptobacteroides sp.]
MENKDKRLMSLDALRGFDMLFIMGFASLVIAVCGLFEGGPECFLAQTMKHVKWNGIAHHDTIFPLFLFIAGISFPFSYSKQKESGVPKRKTYLKIFKRAITLIILGMVYNGCLDFDFGNMRVASVLGRIGLAWMCAAIIFINFKPAARWSIAVVILVGYWLLIRFVPAPDVPGADPLSMEGNLVGYVDRMLMPGKLIYNGGRFDPEGLLSTLPAIVTAMLGMFAGEFVRLPEDKVSGSRKALWMFVASLVMLGAGLLWSLDFPINKMLWSSSFVLVVGAYSLAMFSLFYYIIDVKGHRKWTLFFRVIGLNSITIYLLQRIVGFWGITKFFLGGLCSFLPEAWASVLMYTGYITISWLVLYFLYKHKVFLKI